MEASGDKNLMKPKLFLRARWENLILITYSINPGLLEPLMPKGLEPDTINSNAFVSLVAFDFLDTKVRGIKVPFHVNFPEINLRFYVKTKEKRGVVFIRELVPKFFIARIANLLFNENYKSIKMTNQVEKNSTVKVKHFGFYDGLKFEIRVEGENNPYLPSEDSLEHFFKEHEWGFGKSKRGETLIYRVEHPFWEIYPVKKYSLNFDFGAIYGKKWEFLNSQRPFNMTLAVGSAVKVFSALPLESGTKS